MILIINEKLTCFNNQNSNNNLRVKDLASGAMNYQIDFMQLLRYLQSQGESNALTSQTIHGSNAEQTETEQDINFEGEPAEDQLQFMQQSDLIALNELSPDIQELLQNPGQVQNKLRSKGESNRIVSHAMQWLNAEHLDIESVVNFDNRTAEELVQLLQNRGQVFNFNASTDAQNAAVAHAMQGYNAEQASKGQVFNFKESLALEKNLCSIFQQLIDSANEKGLSPVRQELQQTYTTTLLDKNHLAKETELILSRAILSSSSQYMRNDEAAYPDKETVAFTNNDLKYALQRPHTESKLSQMLQEFILLSKTKQAGSTIINASTDAQCKMNLNNQNETGLMGMSDKNAHQISSNTPTSSVFMQENGSNKQVNVTTNPINNDILFNAKSADVKTINLTKIEANNVYMQLAEAIRGQVSKEGQGQTHVSLQLQPKNLGEIIIKIIYRDGNIVTHFQTASEQAKHMIENSLTQLKETLSSFNLNLQNASVSVGGDNNRRGQNWDQNRQHKKQYDDSSRKTMAINENAFVQSTENINGTLDKLNYFV